MEIREESIVIIGCGPGSREYLVQAACAIIDSAEVLVGSPRLLALFSETRALPIRVGVNISAVLDEMALHVGIKRVIVLVTGDPGLSSLARPVVQRFGRKACRIIPGISSIQMAFARLAVDWQEARIVSAHSGIPSVEISTLANETKIAVLTAGKKSRSWLCSLAKLVRGEHAIFVCSDLTLPEEKVKEVSTEELETVAISSLAVVLFIHKKELI